MQVYERLHWLGDGAGNAFLVAPDPELWSESERENGWLLVDTGMRGKPDVLGYLQKLGHSPTALTDILITHADIDHIGNLAAIHAATQANVYVGAETVDLLVAGKFPKHNHFFIDRIVPWLIRPKTILHSAMTIVNDGDCLPLMGGIDVLFTPGHTPDHYAFHSVSTGILFAGDALTGSSGDLACVGPQICNDHALARVSAYKLACLTPILFACGHGEPFLHSNEQLEALFESLRIDL